MVGLLLPLIAQPSRRRTRGARDIPRRHAACAWEGTQQPNHGNLLAQRIATDAVRLLRPLVERIHRHDRNLADQLKRAASSVVLDLAEAAYNNGGHRRSRFESARGSANEVRAALTLASAWGYIPDGLRVKLHGDAADMLPVSPRVASTLPEIVTNGATSKGQLAYNEGFLLPGDRLQFNGVVARVGERHFEAVAAASGPELVELGLA